MTIIEMIIFGAACLLIGLSKGGLGGSLPVSLVIPLLSLVMDPREAVPLTTPFLIFADIFALRLYWGLWDSATVRLLLPSALVGIVMGGFLLSAIPTAALKIIIGISTLLVVIYKLLSDRLKNVTYHHAKWHGYLAGWSSAMASTLANTGGPIITTYLLLQKMPAVTFIGTVTLLFAIVNSLKLPIYWQQGLFDIHLVWQVIWAVPIVPIGVWLGRRSLDFIDQKTFEAILMAMLLVSIGLLFGTL